MASDIKTLVKAIEGRGYDVVMGGGGHLLVKKDGKVRATLPSTPDDPRFWQNAIRDLKSAGVLEIDPKKEGQMATKTRRNTQTPEQRDLRERLQAALNDMGYQPDVRTGVQATFVRNSIEVAKRRGIRGFKNIEAGQNVIRNFLRHHARITQWSAELITATLDEMEGKEATVAPNDMYRGLRDDLKAWMEIHETSVRPTAELIWRWAEATDRQNWATPVGAQAATARFLSGGTDWQPWVIDLFTDFVAADLAPDWMPTGPTYEEALGQGDAPTYDATPALTNGRPDTTQIALQVAAAASPTLGVDEAVRLAEQVVAIGR